MTAVIRKIQDFMPRWTISISFVHLKSIELYFLRQIITTAEKLTFEHPGTGQMLQYNTELPTTSRLINQYALNHGKLMKLLSVSAFVN